MAKQTWVRVANEWKALKSVWTNIGGTWKKDVMPYAWIGGVAKECMSYVKTLLYSTNIGGVRNSTTTNTSSKASNNSNYIIESLMGNSSPSSWNTVEALDEDLVIIAAPSLTQARTEGGCAAFNNMVVFASGMTTGWNNHSISVNGYTSDLDRVTFPNMVTGRRDFDCGVTSSGSHLICPGGITTGGASGIIGTVEGYDEDLLKIAVPALSQASYTFGVGNVGQYLFISGGGTTNLAIAPVINNVYDNDLVKHAAPNLTQGRGAYPATFSFKDYYVILGGSTHGHWDQAPQSGGDAYDSDLLRLGPLSLSEPMKFCRTITFKDGLQGGIFGAAKGTSSITPISKIELFDNNLVRSSFGNLQNSKIDGGAVSQVGINVVYSGYSNVGGTARTVREVYTYN